MRYCGIDASTTSTGLGVFEDDRLIYYECIKPKSKDWQERLKEMSKRLYDILNEWKPKTIYMEDVPLKDGKPTLVKLSNVQGIVRGLCALFDVELNLLKVNEWRQNAGFYTGNKADMERSVLKEKAKQEVKDLFGLEVNDDIAEGILVGFRTVYPKEKKKCYKAKNHK